MPPLTIIRRVTYKVPADKDSRVSAKQAGYLELPGAKKDADCGKVKVEGGVSSALGCCNLFDLKDGAEKKFSCGTCEYVKK